jgi:hypothetical protein
MMTHGGMRIVLAVFQVIGISLLNFDANATGNNDTCSDTSTFDQNACKNAANEVYQLALGRSENELDRNQDGCESDAKAELGTALQVFKDQFAARQAICKEVGPRALCTDWRNCLPLEPVGGDALNGVLPDGSTPECSTDLQKIF